MSEPELGRMLQDAVPDVPAPVDRLAEVAGRVRRRRCRRSAAAIGAAVASIAVVTGVAVLSIDGSQRTPEGTPTASAPAVEIGPDGCPSPTAQAPATDPVVDRPGQLVPDNPTEIVLCEQPTPGMPWPTWQPEPVAQRPLRTNTAEFAVLLNRSRTAAQQLDADRELATRQGGDPKQVALACSTLGYPTVLSFVLRYPDREPVPVLMDQNCGSIYADGRTRFYGGLFRPDDEFLRRYRDVLAARTDPASIPTPACADALSAKQLDLRQLPSGPRDEIAPNRRSRRDGLVPNAVIALTGCRYDVSPDGARLAVRRESRAPSDVRDILNEQATAAAASPPGQPGACGQPDGPAPTVLDVLTVVDATGALMDVWVYRAPCTAAIATGLTGSAPTPRLLGILDGLLGPR